MCLLSRASKLAASASCKLSLTPKNTCTVLAATTCIHHTNHSLGLPPQLRKNKIFTFFKKWCEILLGGTPKNVQGLLQYPVERTLLPLETISLLSCRFGWAESTLSLGCSSEMQSAAEISQASVDVMKVEYAKLRALVSHNVNVAEKNQKAIPLIFLERKKL